MLCLSIHSSDRGRTDHDHSTEQPTELQGARAYPTDNEMRVWIRLQGHTVELSRMLPQARLTELYSRTIGACLWLYQADKVTPQEGEKNHVHDSTMGRN